MVPRSSDRLELEPDEVHVWSARLSSLAPPSEATRRLATRSRPDRRARAASWDLVRRLIASYLGCTSAEVSIDRRCSRCGRDHLPPRIRACGAEPLRVSASYAPGVAAYAIAREPVGIDVESLRQDIDWRGVAAVTFTAAECEALEHDSRRAPLDAFLAIWTRREAVGKALGTGIALGAEDLDRRAEAVSATWSIASGQLAMDDFATVAVARPSVSVRHVGWIAPDGSWDPERLALRGHGWATGSWARIAIERTDRSPS